MTEEKYKFKLADISVMDRSFMVAVSGLISSYTTEMPVPTIIAALGDIVGQLIEAQLDNPKPSSPAELIATVTVNLEMGRERMRLNNAKIKGSA